MGKPLVKLTQGARVLDLNDQSRYWLSQDFTPPETAITPIFAGDAGDVFDQVESNRSFSFTVAIMGSSSGQIDNALRAIKTMLNQAGKQREPLYLLYNASDTVPDPLWGQFGVTLRYEVAHGEVVLSDGYMVGVRRSTDINVMITLTIKPYALGLQQRLCSATGGIIEDTLGTADGLSRGLIVPAATTNKMTNPVFGHATWSNGWTNAGGLTASNNTDKRFVLNNAQNSALLVSNNTSTGIYYQSINFGNTNTHTLTAYVKLPDGGTVSGTNCTIYYSSGKAATYANMGNGIWRVSWSGAGIASSTATGLRVLAGYTVYLLGFFVEELAYSTPPCWGDLLGCAWTGTAHASTSTRTAAACKISIANDTLRVGTWTIRAVVKMAYASTDAAARYIFDGSDGTATDGPLLYVASGTFAFGYAGVAVDSGALTYAAGATYVLHAVCSGSTITLYVNGVAVATSAAFAATALGAALFIGSSYASADHSNATTLGFATFDTALTATQIAADYANAAAAISDGARLESTPWLWTKDGDNVVDNCNDATRDNWCVVGGVPGSAPSETDMLLNSSDTALDTYNTLWLSNTNQDEFVLPDDLLYGEQSGTADATCSGGEKSVKSVDTTDVLWTKSITWPKSKSILGQDVYLLIRSIDAGVNLTAAIYYSDGAGKTLTAYSSIESIPSFRLHLLGPLSIVSQMNVLSDEMNTLSIGISMKRSAAGAANVTVDYFNIFTNPTLKIENRQGTIGADRYIRIKGTVVEMETTDEKWAGGMNATGSKIEFSPDSFNVLQCLQGFTLADPVITATITFVKVNITPRWNLL